MVALSRRGFLAAAGTAVGGALLGGCGAEEAAKAPPTDADVLARLLRLERAVVAAMVGTPALRDQDRRHAARLARELAARGRDPDAVERAPEPISKQGIVFAYVAALPQLTDPDLRALAMEIAASEAAHLAVLRIDVGREPVPDPFAGFAE